MISFSKNKSVRLFMILAIFVYCAVFSVLAVLKYNAYNMAMVDLGRMDQASWNTAHGRILMNTWETGDVCRLSGHSELIFLPISLFYLFFPSPVTLLILQTIVIAFGAAAVYLIANFILKDKMSALAFFLAYLLNPSIQFSNLIDFHPDMLALSFLLFTFYFILKKNWAAYFLFLLLSLSCKEYVSLVAFMLGVYLFFKGNRKIALVTMAIGVLWFFVTYKIFPLYFSQDKQNFMIYHYKSLGGNMGEVFKNIITHPVKNFIAALTKEKILYAALLLLPLGFLSIFNLPALLIGFPVFLGLFLTRHFSYANHHNGVIIPFIFISAIKGAEWLSGRFKNIKRHICVYVLSCSMFCALLYGPSPLSFGFWNKDSHRYWGNLHQYKISRHDRIADTFVKMIPAQASVSASNHLASHLSQRRVIYHFPYPKDFSGIDFILVDLLEYSPFDWLPRQEEKEYLKGVLLSPDFSLKAWQDGILLFEKGYPKKNAYNNSVKIVDSAVWQHAVGSAFGDMLSLEGYDLDYSNRGDGFRFHITYYWQVLGGFDKKFDYSYFRSREKLKKSFIIVDKFKSADKEFRLAHIPLYLLHPPSDWKAGEVIKEELDFVLPEDISKDNFSWNIGLYCVPGGYFINTERKGIVPGTDLIRVKKGSASCV